jgi:hypothetical protein
MNKNKPVKFTRNVFCTDDYASYPSKAIITLTKEDATRILELSGEVNRLGVYNISCAASGMIHFCGKDSDLDEPWRMDYKTLNVADDDFYFEADIHNSCEVSTAFISIKDLKRKFPGLRTHK